MYQNKRILDFSDGLSVKAKKIRKETNEITCIEHLSNEVFYEIFEFLNGCDIYQAFSNLNSRFRHLTFHSSFPIKIKFDNSSKSKAEHYSRNVILPNRHHILSIYFENESFLKDFLKHCLIDSSFRRLESIYLNDISSDSFLFMLLSYLQSLSRLFSLTINLDADYPYDLSAIYRMIFSLPTLKYNKLSLFSDMDEELRLLVPLAINQQFSTIEYLIVNHDCTFDELCSMLQHTPQLRHLSCKILMESDDNINRNNLVTLSNLIYLNIGNCQIGFKEFEIFIKKISSQLQIMNIAQYIGEGYLDADRWERLIKTYIPCLHRFNYKYCQLYIFDDEDILYNKNFDRFNSSFWIERQWFLEIEFQKYDIIYSINSYKNLYLDIYKHSDIATFLNYNFMQYFNIVNQNDIDKSSTMFIPTIQCSIKYIYETRNKSWIDKFKSIYPTIQFTRLNIDCKNISTEILVKIIHMLPNLDSLKVISLPIIQQNWLFDNNGLFLYLTSIRNKITKVNLEKIIDIEQVYFLLYLCIRAEYFQVDVPKNMNLEIFLRSILIKADTYKSQLRFLCLYTPNVNEKIVHQLQKLIDTEHLRTNYMIKHISDNILLKWN